jgi:hypothetical protein
MSMETTLYGLLAAICPRVYPDVAPAEVARPYLTWQAIGGESMRFGDGSAHDKRHTLMQVSVWSTTRAEAISLIHQVETALCGHTGWQAEPQGEAVSIYEPDTELRGSVQRYEIWATR